MAANPFNGVCPLPHGFELTADWAVETPKRKADVAKVIK
jgi:hypothetical protein